VVDATSPDGVGEIAAAAERLGTPAVLVHGAGARPAGGGARSARRPARAAGATRSTRLAPPSGGSLMAATAWSLHLADSRGRVGLAAALGPEDGRLAPLLALDGRGPTEGRGWR
jgi:hypothetical protein